MFKTIIIDGIEVGPNPEGWINPKDLPTRYQRWLDGEKFWTDEQLRQAEEEIKNDPERKFNKLRKVS